MSVRRRGTKEEMRTPTPVPRAIAVLVYLLGLYGQGLHVPINEPVDPRCTGPDTGSYLSAGCDGPCRHPDHHHHPRPSHDRDHCLICQQVFLACEVTCPPLLVIARDVPGESRAEPVAASPFTHFLTSLPTRGPPRIS